MGTARLCRKKCRIWNNKHPDEECVAWNWRTNNKKFPYKMRRRCILLKTKRKVVEKPDGALAHLELRIFLQPRKVTPNLKNFFITKWRTQTRLEYNYLS